MIFVLAIIGSGCRPREPKSGYIARVGDSYLTWEEMQTDNDSTPASSDARIRQGVARWVNNELLYQEARRQGLENSEMVQLRLRDVRKELSIEAFLQKEIYGDTVQIAEDSIRGYYAGHPQEFILREDLVQVNLVAFSDRAKANSFRSKIVGGSRWDAVLTAAQNDTSVQKSMTMFTSARYHTQQTLFPPELWRVAMNLPPGEISFPVRTQGSFVLIQTLARYRQGTNTPLDFARSEIRQRLIIERRRQRYSDLIARLRSRYEVEITVP